MSQKFSTFVNMINNKSNIEMQLATYKSMLTKVSNDLAKSKQLVGLLKQQIEQGNTVLSEELDKANERISMLLLLFIMCTKVLNFYDIHNSFLLRKVI